MSIGEILGIAVGALTPLGGAGAFIWNKVEKRFGHIENQLEECEKREIESLERRGVQLTVIELLWQEVKRLAPDAPVLGRAKRLLDELKDQNNEARN